jgi:hypothetical protein
MTSFTVKERLIRKGGIMSRFGFFVLAALLALGLTGVSAQEVSQDPCANNLEKGQIGVPFKNHCLLVEPEKGPVQGCIVKRTVVEDLDSKAVLAEGVVLIHYNDGESDTWSVAGIFNDDVTGETTGDELGDCFVIEWES